MPQGSPEDSRTEQRVHATSATRRKSGDVNGAAIANTKLQDVLVHAGMARKGEGVAEQAPSSSRRFSLAPGRRSSGCTCGFRWRP